MCLIAKGLGRSHTQALCTPSFGLRRRGLDHKTCDDLPPLCVFQRVRRATEKPFLDDVVDDEGGTRKTYNYW